MSEATQAAVAVEEVDGWEWAVVEIYGHRRHAGRTREVERFGATMIRVDVPIKGSPAEHGWTTHFYGGSAIFSFTLSDEATCLRINKPYQSPSRLSLPAADGDAVGVDVVDLPDGDEG